MSVRSVLAWSVAIVVVAVVLFYLVGWFVINAPVTHTVTIGTPSP